MPTTAQERRRGKRKSRRARREHEQAEALRVPCCCAKCLKRGRRWPSNYVGNGVGALYAPGEGRLVRGISYEDYIEGSRVHLAGHAEQGGAGTTSSPTAAAIAELEVRGRKVEHQKIKRNREDEAETRRAYARAARDGWRVVGGRWVKDEEGGWKIEGGRRVRAPAYLEGMNLVFAQLPEEPQRCAA